MYRTFPTVDKLVQYLLRMVSTTVSVVPLYLLKALGMAVVMPLSVSCTPSRIEGCSITEMLLLYDALPHIVLQHYIKQLLESVPVS
jgi:hypothetical protein